MLLTQLNYKSLKENVRQKERNTVTDKEREERKKGK